VAQHAAAANMPSQLFIMRRRNCHGIMPCLKLITHAGNCSTLDTGCFMQAMQWCEPTKNQASYTAADDDDGRLHSCRCKTT
jgi:hypothetical protein